MAIKNGWIFGIILVIIGSIGNNLGNNLVSLGHSIDQKKEEEENRLKNKLSTPRTPRIIDNNAETSLSTEVSEQPLKNSGSSESLIATGEEEKGCFQSLRCIGTFIFVFGNLFTFVSFAFGAQSLIASLESIQFVSNIFFAKYVHKEIITNRMIYATLSIIIGNIMVVLFANHHAQKFSSTDMIYLYKTNYIYHGYLAVAFFIWLLCSLVYRKYHHSRMVLRTLLWKHNFLEPFCFAVSSAIIGTQAVLNSKCLALLIDSTTSGGNKNEFTFWYLYFVLGTWLLLVAYWLRRLDQGLSLFPPLFIIPVMQVFFVFFAILCGGIYFQEFVKFSLSQYIGFCVGVTLILTGVYGLAPTDMKLYIPPPDEFETDESMKLDEYVQNHQVHDNNDSDLDIDLEKNESGIHSTKTNHNSIKYDSELDIIVNSDVKIKPDPTPTKQPNKSMIALHNCDDVTISAITTTDTTKETMLTTAMNDSDIATIIPQNSSKKNRKVVTRPVLPPLIVVSKSVQEIPHLNSNSNANNNCSNIIQVKRNIDEFIDPSLLTSSTTTNNENIFSTNNTTNSNTATTTTTNIDPLSKGIDNISLTQSARDYMTANITPSITSRENYQNDNK